jgi:DNA-binding CsgD family transcriptional regulator
LLWREDRQRLHPAARNDPGWNPRSSYSCAPGEGLIGQTFVANRPFAAWNYPDSPHALSTAVTAGIKSGLAVPLASGGLRIGVLSVRNYYQARFTTGHIRLLMLLGSLVAPALELARSRRQRPPVRLTAREALVLEEIMAGRPAKAIATRHGIAEATVRTHIRALLSKFGVSSQLAAVAAARELGLVPGFSKIGETRTVSSR